MDSPQALRTAASITLSQLTSLPLEEVEARIVSMCLHSIERSRHYINAFPALTGGQRRALYRRLVCAYVAENETAKPFVIGRAA